MPGMYLIYHADPAGEAGLLPGATRAPGTLLGRQSGFELSCESPFALTAEERGNVERRSGLELRARSHVVRCRRG